MPHSLLSGLGINLGVSVSLKDLIEGGIITGAVIALVYVGYELAMGVNNSILGMAPNLNGPIVKPLVGVIVLSLIILLLEKAFNTSA